MTNLMQASREWSSRPSDERFTSLQSLADHCTDIRNKSRTGVLANRRLTAIPTEGDESYKSLSIREDKSGMTVNPTHWSFGQLAARVQAPAGYLRSLPSPMAADCLNFGLKHVRDVEELGLLTQVDDAGNHELLRAATGPNYGRIWNGGNDGIATLLLNKFGNSDFTIPGEFGKAVEVTKQNTTLYASDRDMFAFLADEKNRIEMPNRRNGETGTLARGFFVWNSEVGGGTCGAAFFLFDYACSNRIVWGAQNFNEIRLRHTSGAPDRWLEQIQPVLHDYSNAATQGIVDHIKSAQAAKIDNVKDFLSKRYTVAKANDYIDAFARDEGRDMESLWDVTTGMTAFARTIEYANDRVAVEREAGKVLAMAA